MRPRPLEAPSAMADERSRVEVSADWLLSCGVLGVEGWEWGDDEDGGGGGDSQGISSWRWRVVDGVLGGCWGVEEDWFEMFSEEVVPPDVWNFMVALKAGSASSPDTRGLLLLEVSSLVMLVLDELLSLRRRARIISMGTSANPIVMFPIMSKME